jgi:hypothetical protein
LLVLFTGDKQRLLILKTHALLQILMATKKTLTATIIIIIAAVTLTVATTAFLNPSLNPASASPLNNSTSDQSNNSVTGINVCVYNDPACTQKCISLDWSALTIGSQTSKTVYIKNAGTNPLKLDIAESDWTPSSANGPITLGWNRENAILDPGQTISAQLTLYVSQTIDNAISDFGFSITIMGKNP